ncbi:hypothetical protein O3P69_008732 [Scylla paramamosain]|uniref:Uncharacterized protein n=1 Tax=Scylla paramamosain TaxID=85552 RepID=A0AAW0SLD8_SCYPA
MVHHRDLIRSRCNEFWKEYALMRLVTNIGDGGLLSLSWNNHNATFCHSLSTFREKVTGVCRLELLLRK